MHNLHHKPCVAIMLSLASILLFSSCASLQQVALQDAQNSFLRGEYQRSLNAISRAENYADFKNPEERAAVLLLKGSCLQQMNKVEDSKKLYQQLIDNYPYSLSVVAARNQLTILNMTGRKHSGAFEPPTLFPFPQIVQLSTDTRVWECGHAAVQNNQAVIEYVLPGETVHNWSELVTIHFAKDGQKNVSVRRLMDVQKEILLQQSPSTKWTILKETQNEILFEWSHPKDTQWPAQHQISKLITNESGMYQFSYVKKTLTLDPVTYETWKEIIGTASVR